MNSFERKVTSHDVAVMGGKRAPTALQPTKASVLVVSFAGGVSAERDRCAVEAAAPAASRTAAREDFAPHSLAALKPHAEVWSQSSWRSWRTSEDCAARAPTAAVTRSAHWKFYLRPPRSLRNDIVRIAPVDGKLSRGRVDGSERRGLEVWRWASARGVMAAGTALRPPAAPMMAVAAARQRGGARAMGTAQATATSAVACG